MVDQILDLMVSGVEAVISWWNSIMISTGMSTVYIVMMSVVISVGILLRPILGGARMGLDAGSDKVSNAFLRSEREQEHYTKLDSL